jgi:hypothetical protein
MKTMKISFKGQRTKAVWVTIVLLLLICGGVLTVWEIVPTNGSAQAALKSGRSATATAESSKFETEPPTAAGATLVAPNMSASAQEEPGVEVEVLTLERKGFEPATIQRGPGRFLLAVTNRSEEDELSLELRPVAGNRLHDVRLRRGRIRSLSDLNLAPGEYVLSETNHPEWTCRISIARR